MMYPNCHLPRWEKQDLNTQEIDYDVTRTVHHEEPNSNKKDQAATGRWTHSQCQQISCLSEVNISRERIILWIQEAVDTFSEVKCSLTQLHIWIERLYSSQGGMDTSQVAVNPHLVPLSSHLLHKSVSSLYTNPHAAEVCSRWLGGGRDGFAPKSCQPPCFHWWHVCVNMIGIE